MLPLGAQPLDQLAQHFLRPPPQHAVGGSDERHELARLLLVSLARCLVLRDLLGLVGLQQARDRHAKVAGGVGVGDAHIEVAARPVGIEARQEQVRPQPVPTHPAIGADCTALDEPGLELDPGGPGAECRAGAAVDGANEHVVAQDAVGGARC